MANLQEVLGKIHAPKGFTSLMAAALGGDIGSVQPQSAGGVDIAGARQRLADVEHAQNTCESDAAFWGYQGDVSYWRAVVNILEASSLVGVNELADLPEPGGLVVMDVCASVERYGKRILELAKARAERENR